MSEAEQQGLDFETPPQFESSVPTFVSAQDYRMLDWRAPRSEPSGAPSGDICAACQQPILIDDEFGLKFQEHTTCFDETIDSES